VAVGVSASAGAVGVSLTADVGTICGGLTTKVTHVTEPDTTVTCC
jgi:hypothetical protein